MTTDLLLRYQTMASIALMRAKRIGDDVLYENIIHLLRFLRPSRVESAEQILKKLKLITVVGAIYGLQSLTFSDFHIVCSF